MREALARYQEYIGPMKREELQRAIEEPARREGWEFELGLVDLLLRDVGSETGRLPLLSHALLETWKRSEGRTLTLGGYHQAGGVRGAIAQTAETVFQQRLTPQQQPIARNIFLRLTELGKGTQDTRRRATPAELVSRPEDAPQVQSVLKILADARLVTTGEDAVQVAHEALIREWPALRRWLDEDRKGLRVHRHLTESARGWVELNRDSGELYRGARLIQALEWTEDHVDELNDLEREFLDSSRTAVEKAKRARDEARERELRGRIASMATGLINDINNAVAAIPDLVTEIEKKLQWGSNIEAPLADLQKSASVTGRISNRLRDFVITGQFNSKLLRLEPLIRKAYYAARDQKPENVTLQYQMNDLNPEIIADGLWIELLVQNLVLNALEAIPSDQEGLVEIEVEMDPDNVYIHVTDNGRGIAEKDLARLFDPGYTTKEDQSSLHGIGLYHCLQVIQAHQGELKVRSAPGVGTVFTAILPRVSSSTASGKE